MSGSVAQLPQTRTVRVAMHQPNYAPWCGYFAKVAASDAFVFLDDVQMPQGRSYVSRVRVAGAAGARWLTIPVRRVSGQEISAVAFAQPRWAEKHLRSLRTAYGRTPFFTEVMEVVEPLYRDPGDRLAGFNIRLVRAVAEYLGIDVEWHRSSELGVDGAGGARLAALARRIGAATYLSGPGGTRYQEPDSFGAAGIGLEVQAYDPLPYPRAHGRFEPGLSILDALFNVGRDAAELLRYD